MITNMLRLLFLGICPLGEVDGNDRQFMLGDVAMDCAPGTVFNLTLCTCVRSEPCKLAATTLLLLTLCLAMLSYVINNTKCKINLRFSQSYATV